MPNRHTYLNNIGAENNGFKKTRGWSGNNDENTIKTINRSRIVGLNQNMLNYNEDVTTRNERRTIEFPNHIELLWIHFYVTFNEDLRRKFYDRYGLLPHSFINFNRSVLFEVVDQESFQEFQNQLTFLYEQQGDVPYTQENYNLIALIDEFQFFDNRLVAPSTDGAILNIIHSTQNIAEAQQAGLINFLNESQLGFNMNEEGDLFYINEISEAQIQEIAANFDIVETITSSRPLTVRPGTFGELRTSYGFNTDIPENLPIIGVVDTGVNRIGPFRDLILPGINITNHPDQDQSGHGTLVAGLCVFGGDLPNSIQEKYQAKCRIFPIKVLHRNTDSIDFPQLLNSIRQANQEHGVRIFNMSLVFALAKQYNESFSHFAYELDRLSYELDILILMSVGNFDSNSLSELLTHDHHTDHNYPEFFYQLNSTSPVHSCENTNICVPSESLNNLSIGALAGNLQDEDQTDISPAPEYPAYYSRKSHLDFEQEINNKPLQQNQKNKFLNKPDLVFEGGDLHRDDSGIEVLADEGQFYSRTAGTSLATPLIASMAAEIVKAYPGLNMQSIKGLLINSATYFNSTELPQFKDRDPLLHKLVGFGKPVKSLGLATDDNSINLVIENSIRYNRIKSIPIKLPEYLLTAGNKLIFNISLVFKFKPDRGNHLGYLPLHLAFNLVQNKPIDGIANNNKEYYNIKNSFSWSEDHHGVENRVFSNVQKKEYRLQPADIEKLAGDLAIAIRCISKANIDPDLLEHYKIENHPFSIIINVREEVRNETGHSLYQEMLECNNLEIIPEAEAAGDADLTLEN